MSLEGCGFLLLSSLCAEVLVLGPHDVLAEISTTGEQQIHGITRQFVLEGEPGDLLSNLLLAALSCKIRPGYLELSPV